jgi:hypothetical protein
MLLTPDQQQRFRDHLRTAGVGNDCMSCLQPIDLAAVAELVTDRFGWPLVRCVCPTCAFVASYYAPPIDLVPAEPVTSKRISTEDIESAVVRAINRTVNRTIT